ncbi:MAG: SIS domain-containing protein [Puniceicoccales bacterium]|jgi:D-sedoheptulose 7-phosphate isomerase|nr:SIS domain-containing protein [Puniceicoccales bacterium]
MKGLSIPPLEILEDLLGRYPSLGGKKEALLAAGHCLMRCYGERERKVLICGNGGSAADAEHMAAELLKSFRINRPSPHLHGLRDEISKQLEGALPAIPIATFSAFQTAYGNDRCGEFSFAQLVFALGVEGDTLFCISTSGNSKNILHAAEVAHHKKMDVIALTGHDGGQLKSLADICICVPTKETHEIQELHLPIYHALCAMVESHIFGN